MMSSPVSTAADAPTATSPAASSKEQPAPGDGWRTGGLPALRAEIDRTDNALHDLLMHRAEVVEQVARSGKPAAFRPGREASIIRRLLARHHGALPPGAVVRIWRELLAGTTAMQGRFSLAVCDADHRAPLTHLAREHFGALTPMRGYATADQALIAVSQSASSVAVLPYPSDSDTWWIALPHNEPRLHIIARLPFWKPSPDGASPRASDGAAAGAPAAQAVVVAATAPDASEQDQSVLGLECDSDVSRTRLSEALSAAALKPQTMVMVRHQGSPIANVLIEVPGHLSNNDPRLGQLGPLLRHAVVLGSYAVPITGAAR